MEHPEETNTASNTLTPDLLALIFGFVPLSSDLVALAWTCRSFNALSAQRIRNQEKANVETLEEKTGVYLYDIDYNRKWLIDSVNTVIEAEKQLAGQKSASSKKSTPKGFGKRARSFFRRSKKKETAAELPTLCLFLVGESPTGIRDVLGEFSEGKVNVLSNETTQKTAKALVSGECKSTITFALGLEEKKIDLRLKVLDTAVQPSRLLQKKTSRTSLYAEAHCCIVCCDVTCEKSWGRVKLWFNEIRKYAVDDVVPILAITNSDKTNARVVKSDQIRSLCCKKNVCAFEISENSGKNVEKMFKLAAQLCVDRFLSEKVE
mmetsp:Transcript_14431/g.16008  ORF Transcript_14431/g.16008 Transcript_14431/m.16008 type:complete len:320 (+) Transcript_14431:60-1019(+)